MRTHPFLVLAACAACVACGEPRSDAGQAAGAGNAAAASPSSTVGTEAGSSGRSPSSPGATGTGGSGAAQGSAGAIASPGSSDAASTTSGATAPADDAAAPAVDAGGGSGEGGAGDAPATAGLPPVTSVDGSGPFDTTQDLATGPNGQSGVFRPAQLGANGLKHPVFVFGCGGTATPSSYANELTTIASHGFVVIAEVENIGDNGAPLLAAADWMVAENARAQSVFYQKLDVSKLGLGGHSIGSVNAFIAGTDPRWTTTIHVAGGSLDDVNNPNAPTTGQGGKSLIHPAAYICDANDAFGNVDKTQKDYDNTTVPVFFTIMAGADHLTAVTAGLPAIVGWLRWQLGGEPRWRQSFLDPQGEFCTGNYMSVSKNW